MINNKEVRKLAEESTVSEEQLMFLELYEDTLNVSQSARDAGLSDVNIRRALASNSEFARLFRRLSDNIDKDPRVNKTASLAMLLDLKKRAEKEGKMSMELKVIQEINKMIEGNLAASKKVVENVEVNVSGIIDLTQPPMETRTIDVSHTEI